MVILKEKCCCYIAGHGKFVIFEDRQVWQAICGQCIGIVVKGIVCHQVACGTGQDPIDQLYQ